MGDLKRSTFRVLEVQPTREYPEENESPQNETTFLTPPPSGKRNQNFGIYSPLALLVEVPWHCESRFRVLLVEVPCGAASRGTQVMTMTFSTSPAIRTRQPAQNGMRMCCFSPAFPAAEVSCDLSDGSTSLFLACVHVWHSWFLSVALSVEAVHWPGGGVEAE